MAAYQPDQRLENGKNSGRQKYFLLQIMYVLIQAYSLTAYHNMLSKTI